VRARNPGNPQGEQLRLGPDRIAPRGLRHSAARILRPSDIAWCFELIAPIRIAFAETITTGVTAAAIAGMVVCAGPRANVTCIFYDNQDQ
jgi:hypothetical protein